MTRKSEKKSTIIKVKKQVSNYVVSIYSVKALVDVLASITGYLKGNRLTWRMDRLFVPKDIRPLNHHELQRINAILDANTCLQ